MLKRQKRDIEQAIDELTHTMTVVAGMLRDREAHDAQPREPILEAAE